VMRVKVTAFRKVTSVVYFNTQPFCQHYKAWNGNGMEGNYFIEVLPGETENKKSDKSENNKFHGLDSKTALPDTC
jgi:hypothetical protein